ncbi:hypothetical protein RR42_s3263 [Cupriavidus basilensis]|uniref:Uncharacterized protein n=1 Tax=Cupriavidus basilensis TaxID=68895 RepID=A0A0C4YSC8_9BURK|nr:hypothetical protein RR42_s3263 [Cupriavidus basilensis]
MARAGLLDCCHSPCLPVGGGIHELWMPRDRRRLMLAGCWRHMRQGSNG